MLINKMKREYLEMRGFVRAWVLLVVVRSNTLLLRGSKEKEAYIHQRPDMADGEAMALIEPWRG